MVTIKLLSIEKEIAFIRCLIENEEKNVFLLELDLANRKILSNTLGEKNSYVVHAARKIFEIFAETGEVPETAVSVWY